MRRPTTLASALIMLAILLLPGIADARPKLAGTFALNGKPGELARSLDGNVWVLVDGSKIARVRPNGNVNEFDPAALTNAEGLTRGPDGNLWATRNGGVVRIPPANPLNAQDFNIAAIADPRGITRGPQGRLWTASGDKLISFLPADPENTFTERTINNMAARGITASGGRLFVADFGGKNIVRVAPGGGVKRFKVGGGPQGVARGPKKSVAYTNQGTSPHTVGRIMPGRQNAKRTRVGNSDPFGIAFAPDRRWWIANFASSDMTLLTPKGKATRFKGLPANSGPRHLTVGKKGTNTVWVGLENSERVARIRGVRR